MPPGAGTCDACGHVPALPAQPEPGSLTPSHLADKIRRQRPSEGERRIVTVLFADAVGSTPLAEQLGEEAMYSFMRECLSRMTEAVHRYEGYIASFTGDGMMALFGAPIAHEDSARRAVAAALRMQRSLEGYAVEMKERHGVEGRFRVGLNTGPVIAGTVTDDLQMDFTAIGDTVNLAARMEQAADPGGVYISEPTHRIVGEYFDCEALGDIAVKGKAQPVRAWRVLGEKPVRTRFEVAAERGLSRFVGRDEELGVLEAYVEGTRRGAGRVVLVSGEAGIGKSRLLLELRRRLGGQDVAWIEGHCISYGANIPYLPVIGLLKRTFAIQEQDADADVIRRVDDVVSAWEASVRGAAPYLKHVLSVDPGDARVATMDPRERRVGVFEALRTLLVQESARRPHVVVAEDLHWADEISREALAALADAVPTAPVLLLLTHRPGYADTLGERAHVARVALGQLGEEEAVALAEDILEGAGLPPDLRRLIAGKAEGNPFYVEEVTKGLVETGVVARSNGGFRLQRPVEDIHIPGTIQEVVLSRIDRLHPDAKRAIQLASVIGREFTVRLLDRISDLEARLSEVLGELKALELIYEKVFFPELAYMFKHALTHDVAYGTLLAERRQALHRLVAAAVEELYGDRLAEHYEILAHHYFEGQDWDKALEYLTKAGDKATEAYANEDALAFYDRALSICDRLSESADPIAASVLAKRGFINFATGHVPAAIVEMDRMLATARRLGSRVLEGTALGYRGILEVWSHDFVRGEATLREAWTVADEGVEEVSPLVKYGLAILFIVTNRLSEAEPLLISEDDAAALPDPFTQGCWNWGLALLHHWRGRPNEAIRVLRSMPDAAARVTANRLFNWWVQGLAHCSKGDYQPALDLLHQTLATSKRVGDVVVRARTLNTLGWLHGDLEDHEQAMRWNRSSLEAAGNLGHLADRSAEEVRMNALLNVGDNLLALGRPDEAEECFRIVEAVVRNERLSVRWMAWRYSQHLFHSYGVLCLRRGDTAGAQMYADECLELADHSASPRNIVKGKRLRGQALMAQGRLDEADAELAAAMETAVMLGNPPQLWKTHAAVGDLQRARGNMEEARRAWEEALSIVDAVARSLDDSSVRSSLLTSDHIERIRRAASLADQADQLRRTP